MKISVVIPVYNAAPWLQRCLRSALDQDFDGLEVVCVDDGSTDDSLAICRGFAGRDARVRVVSRAHGGAAAARNTGIDRAAGAYILFLDSDDYLEPGALSALWEAAQADALDMVRCGRVIERGNGSFRDVRRERIGGQVTDGAAYFAEAYRKRAYACSPGPGLCRREFLVENGLFFREGITHEDELFMPCALVAARRVRYVDRCLYHYVMREGSVMHAEDPERRGDDLVTVAMALACVKDVPRVCRRAWEDNLLGKYFAGFTVGRGYRRELRGRFDRTFPLRHAASVKNGVRAAVFAVSFRGFYLLNRLGNRFTRALGIVRS